MEFGEHSWFHRFKKSVTLSFYSTQYLKTITTFSSFLYIFGVLFLVIFLGRITRKRLGVQSFFRISSNQPSCLLFIEALFTSISIIPHSCGMVPCIQFSSSRWNLGLSSHQLSCTLAQFILFPFRSHSSSVEEGSCHKPFFTLNFLLCNSLISHSKAFLNLTWWNLEHISFTYFPF